MLIGAACTPLANTIAATVTNMALMRRFMWSPRRIEIFAQFSKYHKLALIGSPQNHLKTFPDEPAIVLEPSRKGPMRGQHENERRI